MLIKVYTEIIKLLAHNLVVKWKCYTRQDITICLYFIHYTFGIADPSSTQDECQI